MRCIIMAATRKTKRFSFIFILSDAKIRDGCNNRNNDGFYLFFISIWCKNSQFYGQKKYKSCELISSILLAIHVYVLHSFYPISMMLIVWNGYTKDFYNILLYAWFRYLELWNQAEGWIYKKRKASLPPHSATVKRWRKQTNKTNLQVSVYIGVYVLPDCRNKIFNYSTILLFIRAN